MTLKNTLLMLLFCVSSYNRFTCLFVYFSKAIFSTSLWKVTLMKAGFSTLYFSFFKVIPLPLTFFRFIIFYCFGYKKNAFITSQAKKYSLMLCIFLRSSLNLFVKQSLIKLSLINLNYLFEITSNLSYLFNKEESLDADFASQFVSVFPSRSHVMNIQRGIMKKLILSQHKCGIFFNYLAFLLYLSQSKFSSFLNKPKKEKMSLFC